MNSVENDVNTIIKNLGEVNFQGRTILVLGGAGFLGSWLCHALIEQGAKVVCLDNLSSGMRTNISHLIKKRDFEFIEHDITQPIHLDQNVDVVMHLASRASPFEFQKFPLEILNANTLGTLVALELAKQHKARFLYASSSEVYGNPAIIPTPETYNGSVNPIGPRSCYEEAKRCGEAYVSAYRKQHGLNTRIARIFNSYGPRMRADDIYGRVVPRFIQQALNGEAITVFGTGEQTRSFCYVTVQVEGLLRLAFLEQGDGEVVNIGSEEEVRIIDLAKMVKQLMSSPSRITFHPLPGDDPQRRCPDTTKAKRILGWKPRVSLEEGLNKTIEWETAQWQRSR